MNAPVVIPIRVWMEGKSRGEIKRFLAGFSCLAQNKEVDEFLHLKAQRFAKRNISATHLVLSADQKNMGYDPTDAWKRTLEPLSRVREEMERLFADVAKKGCLE